MNCGYQASWRIIRRGTESAEPDDQWAAQENPDATRREGGRRLLIAANDLVRLDRDSAAGQRLWTALRGRTLRKKKVMVGRSVDFP